MLELDLKMSGIFLMRHRVCTRMIRAHRKVTSYDCKPVRSGIALVNVALHAHVCT